MTLAAEAIVSQTEDLAAARRAMIDSQLRVSGINQEWLLAAMARVLGGYPDTESATCTGADRYGLDLRVNTARGMAYTRVGYAQPLQSIDELRSATVELARLSRQA